MVTPPTILRGAATLSPTNYKAAIIGCNDIGPGNFNYIVSYNLYGATAENIAVRPEDILDYVSAAELEAFESRHARQERRQLQEFHNQTHLKRQLGTDNRGTTLLERDIRASSRHELNRMPAGDFSRSKGLITAKVAIQASDLSNEIGNGKNKGMLPVDEDEDDDSSEVHEEGEFEIEAILGDRIIGGLRFFFIKWVGYPTNENSWLTEHDLIESASELVQQYLDGKEKHFEIDNLVEHRYDSDGELSFRVKWKGYPDEDTWEPEVELPRALVQQYLSSKRLVTSFSNYNID